MSREALGLLLVGRSFRAFEGLHRQDRRIEYCKRGEDRGVGVLELDDDGMVALRRDVLDGADEKAPDSVLGVGRPFQRPLNVGGSNRRPVGEFDPVAQCQRHAEAVVGNLPVGGKARLEPLAVIGRQDQRVV